MIVPKLNNVYDKIIMKAKEIILLGDLNIDMMCMENDLHNDFVIFMILREPNYLTYLFYTVVYDLMS